MKAVFIASLLVSMALPAMAATQIDTAPIGGLQDLGASGSARMVEVAVMLAHRNPAALDQLVLDQSNPASPFFRQFLTPDQFRDAFAATEADFARVAASLSAAGFRVSADGPNRLVIGASAPAPVAAAYFGTEIHDFAQDGEVHYGNAVPAAVPAAIGDVVSGVVGLSDIKTFHIDVAFPTQRDATAAVQASSIYYGSDGGLTPAAFTKAYRLPAAGGHTGTGHAAAIVIDADYLDSDINTFLSTYGITRTGTITRVPVNGGPAPGLTADSVETELDVETISSLAPGADVYVYEGLNFINPSNLITAYNAVLNDNKVDSVNASLGYCETAYSSFAKMVDQLATQGAALGITFHASTGDNGNVTYGCNNTSVDVPAAAPHVVAVGGSSLTVNRTTGAVTSEVGWTGNSIVGASGGGVSVKFALPSFQSGVANVVASGRNTPDIAFDANPNTGATYYYNGSFQGPIGGTSLASPIFGAALVELNQIKAFRAGYLNPVLYTAWLKDGYGSGGVRYFRDMVSGSDGLSNGAYSVQKGYDQVTGIGVPLVQSLSSILAY